MRPNLRRTAFALALCASATAEAGALLDLYGRAADNDKVLEAARHQRDAALQARPQALAALLPQINGQASYEIAEQTTKTSTARFGDPAARPLQQDDEQTQIVLALNVTQAVFDWAAFSRLKQASARTALAEAGFEAAAQNLILRTAQAYFNVLTAGETLRAAQAQKASIGRQLEQSRQRFEVGLSAITDVQDAQARSDLAVAQEVQAEVTLAAARRALAQITGSADNNVIAVREDLPLAGPDPGDSAAWSKAAREANLAVVVARLNERVAQGDVSVAHAGHLPTLGLQGGYRDSDGDATTDGVDFPVRSQGTQVQAVLNVPLFAGGAVRAGVRAASSIAQQRRAEAEDAERTAERTAGDAYQGVLAGIASVKALKAAVVSSRTALEASEVGLQVGTRTSVDVLNAQQLLFTAESNYAQARYNYLLSVLQLKAAAGRLTAADLAEIDRLLVAG